MAGDAINTSSPPDGAPAAVVAGEWPCEVCDYNLMGLATDSRCPECATPVARSLRARYLRLSDPKWLGTIAGGARMLGWSLALAIALHAITLLAMLRLIPPWVYRGWRWTIPAIAHGLIVWGAVYRLTEPEALGAKPSSAARSSAVAAARLRTLAAWGISLSILHRLLLQNFTVREFAAATGIGLTLLAILWCVLLYGHLRRLARRLPDPSLARWFHVVQWALPLTIGASSLLTWLLLFVSARAYYNFATLTFPGILATIAIDVVALVSLRRFRDRLLAPSPGSSAV